MHQINGERHPPSLPDVSTFSLIRDIDAFIPAPYCVGIPPSLARLSIAGQLLNSFGRLSDASVAARFSTTLRCWPGIATPSFYYRLSLCFMRTLLSATSLPLYPVWYRGIFAACSACAIHFLERRAPYFIGGDNLSIWEQPYPPTVTPTPSPLRDCENPRAPLPVPDGLDGGAALPFPPFFRV